MITLEISHCRLCRNTGLDKVLDLGVQKIANQFHDGSGPLQEAPLVLCRCTRCGLAQLRHSVEPDAMYRKYWYRSGVNQTMRTHLQGIAEEATRVADLRADDVAIDIGCNDGTLLNSLPANVRKVGVDPSNIPPKGELDFYQEYFDADISKEIVKKTGKRAKLVTSIAMFYDLSDPKAFVRAVRDSLQDDGTWIAEMSYTPKVMDNNAYDSICHEHVAYYNLCTFMEAVHPLFNVTNVGFNGINGGSFRVTMSPTQPMNHGCVLGIIDWEQEAGYCDPLAYEEFAKRVSNSRKGLMCYLDLIRDKKVYGYGASTKGQTIMQYCGIGPQHMVAIAERNPDKYGLLTPGTDVRICTEQEMREDKPDYVVCFPWYFWDEFCRRESDLLSKGTRFILPLPIFSIKDGLIRGHE